MITKSTWALAESAAERYLSVIQGLRGAYAHAVGRPNPTTPKARTELQGNAYAIARTFLESEDERIAEATDQIALRALADAREALGVGQGSPEALAPLSELLGASGGYLRQEIVIQIERDIATATKRLRDLALGVNLTAAATGISQRAAVIKAQIADSASFQFFFTDRAGRKLPSQKFIRALWRQHLLNTYVDVFAATLADHGHTTIQVTHPDPNHKWAGAVLSLVQDSREHQTLDAVREEVFHPNSEASVGLVSHR